MQFRGMSRTEANAIVDLWTASFENERQEDVRQAVVSYINSENEFYPKVGDIKALLPHSAKDNSWMRKYIKGSEYQKQWEQRHG